MGLWAGWPYLAPFSFSALSLKGKKGSIPRPVQAPPACGGLGMKKAWDKYEIRVYKNKTTGVHFKN